MENMSNGLSHLFMTVFLHCFSAFMVIPAITDITMSALCPGKDECSIAIYLTGIQQAIIGLGSLIIMPVLGNLSDTYGRKVMLMVPLTLSIFPLVILAYSRTKYFFYAYYILRTLVAMVCEGNVHCLALAYVADVVPESRRASVFGVLSGIASSAFVCGNLSTRFLSTASTFQYFLKAQFHFNKDQFADLLIISGIAGSISQLLLMPILVPALGEEKLLSVGLFFNCVHMLLYSIAWSSWVPYASALISVMSIFAMPCLKSMASKQVGPNEQGKVQGCITGICSFASMVSPLIFSPLTALFLSEHAPFHFPGFGLACAAFALMVAFIESFMINSAIPVTDCSLNNSESAEP
ncbi:tetracycline resistance protein, class A isoform X2 [Capsicum annuum]|uniref:tetracycline resistance protein, class A isoform X2 n=1 Tax=Capsicum annuum TaxID=4072 RepID=UPI001FB061DF|nr:tetracycline resistance protein, class A isoform X2 [Capsicum annuum]